jgi:hypothetical protein
MPAAGMSADALAPAAHSGSHSAHPRNAAPRLGDSDPLIGVDARGERPCTES